MTKNIYPIVFGLLVLVSVFACEEVEEPFIEANPFTGEYDSDLPIRKILIDDFTGINCVNCPEASMVIEDLKETYGNHIVPIGIHTGSYANPIDDSQPDFRTDVGYELGGDGITSLGFFNVAWQPFGVVNRTQFGDNYYQHHSEWATLVVGILKENKFADIDIKIINEFNEESNILDIDINVKAIIDVASRLTLSVYLVENRITGHQSGAQNPEEYEHNHVLRAGINGTWGDEISTSIPFAQYEELSIAYSDTLNTDWIPANCEVVTFVYDSETLEVIQAEQEPVISK